MALIGPAGLLNHLWRFSWDENIFKTTWLKSHLINNNHDKNYCHTIASLVQPDPFFLRTAQRRRAKKGSGTLTVKILCSHLPSLG